MKKKNIKEIEKRNKLHKEELDKRNKERDQTIKLDNGSESTIYKLKLRHQILIEKEQKIIKEKDSIEEMFKKNKIKL